MPCRIVKRFLHNMLCIESLVVRKESRRSIANNPLDRMHTQLLKTDSKDDLEEKAKFCPEVSKIEVEKQTRSGSGTIKYGFWDKDLNDGKWRVELAWLTKVLEPALQFCKWALPTGHEVGNKNLFSSPSFTEIIANIQRSKIGIQDWSFSDLTIGLYLIYLRQASTNPFEATQGVQISSDAVVQDLIYHIELAKGSYKDTPSSLARNSMLRESNVLKFVKNSSVMRPGYYIGVDTRTKLVIFGIRGTHTVYDLVTDIVASSDKEVTFEGYSTHFGTAEAARWFLNHELGTIKNCLEKYEGYRLRLVGHSLGGAIASLLGIMLRKKSRKELGFDPDIISAIGYGTPPCVSRELAESCSDFVTTVVMQDDIIPRLSVASLTRLRNEILQTDWRSVVEKGDWKSVIDLVSNAKQVISSVHGVAQKLVEYAKFADKKSLSDDSIRQELKATPLLDSPAKADVCPVPELFVPGTVYYLKRNDDSAHEYFTLWRRHPNEHFERIVLSSNLISDHRCDSHYYALRDVLKGLPGSNNEGGSASNDSSSKTLSTQSTRRKKDCSLLEASSGKIG